MNERRLPLPNRAHARELLMIAVSLTILLLVTTLPAVAEYDPTRPSSSKGKGGSAPSGGTGRKVALGVAMPDVSIGTVDSVSNSVGRKPAMWVLWSQWGGAHSRAFPSAYVEALQSRNIQPVIWWEPVDPSNLSDPTYPRHKNIIAGNHDSYIRQWARNAKAAGGTVLVRFAHEINNNYFPWSVNSFDNNPTTFKNAWRHVVDIFRQEGANNVKWVWSVVKKTCAGGCNPYIDIYPGNNYVDIMGFSAYNWGDANGKSWTGMYDGAWRVTENLREISNKPIMMAETGSNSIGGNKAEWIRDGYREVYQRLPDVDAIVYLNADLRNVGHPDWRLTSPAGAMAAYSEIAQLSQFETRSPFRARSSVTARLDRDKADKSKSKKEKTRNRVTRKKAHPSKEPVGNKGPRVQKGTVVDPKSRDNTTRGTKARVTRKPKNKKPQPIEVLDPFSR